MPFSINFNDTFRSAGWKEGAKKILSFQRYIFLLKITFLDITWNSVIYDIALPCNQLCNLNLKCLFLKAYSYFKYS